MNDASGLAGILQTYGPWGLVSILLAVVGYQWRAYVEVRDRNDLQAKEQTQKAMALVEEGVRAAVEHRNTIDKLAGALISLERRLENVEKKAG